MTRSLHPGSALLLTVVVISLLTTTTLGALAVRFDQLASTSKVNSSGVARLAAEAGVNYLKGELAAGNSALTAGQTLTYDLTQTKASTLTTGQSSATYRPNPRDSAFAVETAKTSLPRCLEVAVLSPWVNTGKYIYGSSDWGKANPALLFYVANVVNATALGTVPGNSDLGAEKSLPIGQLTNMGQFYNPFAPLGVTQDNPAYWTIKVGGPDDEFLTKKAADGTSSYYKGLDVLYVPYLPRFADSILFTGGAAAGGFARQDAATLQTKFQDTITSNGFKVWLDASVSSDDLYKHGLADLFADNSPYRLRWLQPTLPNDIPEADLAGPYTSSNIESATPIWTKQAEPLLRIPPGPSGGWDTAIVRGSVATSFLRFSGSQSFTPSSSITGALYGSLEGLRLGQLLTIVPLAKDTRSRIPLKGKQNGSFTKAKITKILTVAGGINVTIQLSSAASDTPTKPDGVGYLNTNEVDMASIITPTQFSTKKSLAGVSINAGGDGTNAIINAGSRNKNCQPSAGSFTACPAVGDIVSLTQSGQEPAWGRVTEVTWSGDGLEIANFRVDKLRESPKPVKDAAVSQFVSDPITGKVKVAVYGGVIVSSNYDGGYYTEMDELWVYDPQAATPDEAWQYVPMSGSPPGALAGASMVADAPNHLVLYGGYRHEGVGGAACDETLQAACFSNNIPGLRMAKRLRNSTYVINPTTGASTRLSQPVTASITKDTFYQVRSVASLLDRSGQEGWSWFAAAVASSSSPLSLDVSQTTSFLTSIPISNSAAGLAKGDEVYLTGTIAGSGAAFTSWGKIEAVNYAAKQIEVRVYGYAGPGPVSLTSLTIRVINRVAGNATCKGTLIGSDSQPKVHCVRQTGSTSGFAVGDLAVLESFDSTGLLTGTLTGYIFDIEGDSFRFTDDETKSIFNDFTTMPNYGQSKDESAVSLPSPRYGGALALDPSGKIYLWQGAQKNISAGARATDVWQLNLLLGWQFVNTDHPMPGAGTYNIQVLRAPYSTTFVTTTTKNDGQITPISPGSWDNSASWKVDIKVDGGEDLARGKIISGAAVVMERQSADGTQESFHGRISGYFGAGHKPETLTISHDAAYPNDTGFKVNSRNIKILMYYYTYRTDEIVATGTLASGKLQIDTTDSAVLPKIPATGVSIVGWRQAGSLVESFTMTVANRDYSFLSGTTHRFTLTPNLELSSGSFRPLSSPSPLAFGANQIASGTSSTSLLALGDTMLAADANWPGAGEWFVTVTDGKPRWQLRFSDSGLQFTNGKDRPGPRLGGSMASFYDATAKSSTVYLTGGMRGRYGTIWKQTAAGNTALNGASWNLVKASSKASEDIPNLFGGSLVVYKNGANRSAVYFGGRLKFDITGVDYGKWYNGPALLGAPDTHSLADGSFFLPGNTVANAGFRSGIETDYPSSINPSLKDSITLQDGPASSFQHCLYLGDKTCDAAAGGQQFRHLGLLGRLSSDVSTGYSWGSTQSVLNPGTAFRSELVGGVATQSLLMSGPAKSLARTNGEWYQDGYYPYRCDNTDSGCLGKTNADIAKYGTTAVADNLKSDKTLMIAGYAKLTGAGESGAILVTGAGVGTALAGSRAADPARNYSYCLAADTNPDYSCKKSNPANYLTWLPDPEDVLFALNATRTLSATDSYKVVGYYGGVKRGYLVVTRPGAPVSVQEIVP